ncbi:MAG: sugar phosphate isomerase/epimerase [Candidatus Latescibacteria bacterium]|nr:sugar phosphate isomerase/epimerase [Candidatus Latescibacterota bacterium]
MKIGITQFVLGNQTLSESLDLCREAGYEAIELLFREGKDLDFTMSVAEVEAVGKKCEAAGVEIASVIATRSKGGNLLSTNGEERQTGKERLRRSLEIAGILGVNCTLLHPGQLTPEGTYDNAWNWLQEVLLELIPVAEANQVVIAVENVWNKFLLSPREMAQFVDDVGSEWVGTYLDTANMMAYGYTEHWIRGLGKRIKKVHFKDFSRSKHSFTPLMEGDTDWPLVMKELRGIGYTDPVIHEVGGSRKDLIETARRMRQIVAL